MKKNTDQNQKEKNEKSKRQNFLFWSVLFLGLFVIVGAGIGVGYLYSSANITPWVKIIYKVLPFPIVKIQKNNIITSRQLLHDVEAVKRFYESKDYSQEEMRVDFSTEQGKIRLKTKEKDVLNKLIEDKIIQKIALSKGICISTEDIDKAVEVVLKESDSDYKKLAINLKSNYGWTIAEFKNKIVKNQLYLKRLFEWYGNNLESSDEYKYIKEIKSKIVEDGANFGDIAGEFSEGKSSERNGEINWMVEGQIIPEISQVISKMEVGQVSDIIISPLGMHVIMLEGKRKVKKEDNSIESQIQLRQIFIQGKSFVNWVQEQKLQIEIAIFLREYQWDSVAGEVIFSSSKLREVEKNIKIKSQGDPSLL